MIELRSIALRCLIAGAITLFISIGTCTALHIDNTVQALIGLLILVQCFLTFMMIALRQKEAFKK